MAVCLVLHQFFICSVTVFSDPPGEFQPRVSVSCGLLGAGRAPPLSVGMLPSVAAVSSRHTGRLLTTTMWGGDIQPLTG